MKTSTRISFRNVASDTEIFAAVERRASRVRRLHRAVESCRVSLDRPSRRRRTGNPLRVAVEVGAAGIWLVASATRRDGATASAVAAVNEAFVAVEKQLKDRRDRRREPRVPATIRHDEAYDLVS
jgi:ribosome-associated translation inhibitor RaiA